MFNRKEGMAGKKIEVPFQNNAPFQPITCEHRLPELRVMQEVSQSYEI